MTSEIQNATFFNQGPKPAATRNTEANITYPAASCQSGEKWYLGGSARYAIQINAKPKADQNNVTTPSTQESVFRRNFLTFFLVSRCSTRFSRSWCLAKSSCVRPRLCISQSNAALASSTSDELSEANCNSSSLLNFPYSCSNSVNIALAKLYHPCGIDRGRKLAIALKTLPRARLTVVTTSTRALRHSEDLIGFDVLQNLLDAARPHEFNLFHDVGRAQPEVHPLIAR
jgi:hypothetical protein